MNGGEEQGGEAEHQACRHDPDFLYGSDPDFRVFNIINIGLTITFYWIV